MCDHLWYFVQHRVLLGSWHCVPVLFIFYLMYLPPSTLIYRTWKTRLLFASCWSSLEVFCICNSNVSNTRTHTHLMALFPGLPRWACARKIKPIWILLKQETMSGCGISWDICKSAPHSRQITMPAPHRSAFYRPDALPLSQPTASKQWRQ